MLLALFKLANYTEIKALRKSNRKVLIKTVIALAGSKEIYIILLGVKIYVLNNGALTP